MLVAHFISKLVIQITQVESLFLEQTGVLQGDALKAAIDQSHQTARTMAAKF